MNETIEEKEKEPTHWMISMLFILSFCSLMYGFSGLLGMDGDTDNINTAALSGGFTGALTMLVFAQILTFLEQLVRK